MAVLPDIIRREVLVLVGPSKVELAVLELRLFLVRIIIEILLVLLFLYMHLLCAALVEILVG